MNLRPSGYEPNELPDCSTPRQTENGAGDGARTRDLNLGKVALYQLSYSRKTNDTLPFSARQLQPLAPESNRVALEKRSPPHWRRHQNRAQPNAQISFAVLGGPDRIRTGLPGSAGSLLPPDTLPWKTRPASDPSSEPFAATSTVRQDRIVYLVDYLLGTMHPQRDQGTLRPGAEDLSAHIATYQSF